MSPAVRKSSKIIGVSVPLPFLDLLQQHLRKEMLAEFFRLAAAEKLKRDYGVDFDADALRIFGKRTDLFDAPPAKLAALRRQAARARAAKESRTAAPSVPSAASKNSYARGKIAP